MCLCLCLGRESEGIHFAVNYLEPWQKKQSGRNDVDHLSVSAKDKRVVVIGGGDTGVDCIATALRQACTHTRTHTHMIHKIAGLPGTLTHSVTSNLILSLNFLRLPITSNNIALSSAQHVTSL